MKRRTAAFLSVIIILVLILPSCGTQSDNTPCREIVSAMTAAEIGLPAGKYYSLAAPEGDAEYLSASLVSSLFGNGSYLAVAEDWLDCALYLSLGNHPCEFAVILCRSRDAAEDTARLLCSRLSAIRITKTDPQYAEILENASVSIRGNYAILIISTDTKNALSAAKKAIRG